MVVEREGALLGRDLLLLFIWNVFHKLRMMGAATGCCVQTRSLGRPVCGSHGGTDALSSRPIRHVLRRVSTPMIYSQRCCIVAGGQIGKHEVRAGSAMLLATTWRPAEAVVGRDLSARPVNERPSERTELRGRFHQLLCMYVAESRKRKVQMYIMNMYCR